MSLYLFRHAEAFQIGEKEGLRFDKDRPLTPKGKIVTAEVCRGLRKLKVGCDLIWHSPLVRAVQTAEILAKEMGVANCEMKEGLSSESESEDLFQTLGDIPPSCQIFLVGHQPYLAEWTVRLISGQISDRITISKSGVVCLELQPGANPPKAELSWLLRAKHLQLIGKG